MPYTPPSSAFYNDGGMGHGGFVATFSTAGAVVLESFNVDHPAKTIEQGNAIGAPLKQASVVGFLTASATAQMVTSSDGTTATIIAQGDTFTAAANYGGDKWYVETAGNSYRSGEYWKQDLKLRKAYN